MSGSFSKEVNISEFDIIFLPDTSFSVTSFPSKQKVEMLKSQALPYGTKHEYQN